MVAERLQEFWSAPAQWLDTRPSNRTARHSDSRRRNSEDALQLNNRHKPAWVESHLATGDAGMTRRPVSEPTSVQGTLGRLACNEGNLGVRMCRKLCEDGRIIDAVDALSISVQRGCHIPYNLFYLILKRCIAQKDLVLGRRIHALTLISGYEGHAFLATHLISLYATHGRLDEAMRVFAKVSAPDAYNWATIIFAYGRHGEPAQAIRLYQHMLESTVEPDNRTFIAVLKACAAAGNLAVGKDVHARVTASAGKPDIFLLTCLLHMYAKCGSIEDARTVFDRLPHKGVVTWTAMIAGYAQQGMVQEALSLYTSMQQLGIASPNSVTFICLLQACARAGDVALDQGKHLHALIEERGLQVESVVGNSLVNMYAKCGSIVDARMVFDRLPCRNVVTWNAMIGGYAQQGLGQEALALYSSMQQEGIIPPNCITFVCLLQACASIGVRALHQGKQLHGQIQERGLHVDVVLGGSLVNMYAKCGSVENAERVFDYLPRKNVVTWTAMIAGYAQQEMGQKALNLYSVMLQEGISPPDSVIFVCLLQACASVGVLALHQGKQLHAQIKERRLQDDLVVGASLVNMYAKCGDTENAHGVFDKLPQKSVVTWTAMIAGYAQQGRGQEAICLFKSMQQEGIITPNPVTIVCMLQACASVGELALHQGKQLHAQIDEQGLQDDVVVGGSLVNMYAKCGSLDDARRVFDRLPHRNVVTWTTMIAGYAQQGMGQEALSVYRSMEQEGMTPPDSVTYLCLLQACATVADLSLGKQLHAKIEERGLQADEGVGKGLVDMYAKCGSMVDSQQVFDSLPERDIVAWCALIAGYTRQGDSEAVFALVNRMRQEGIQPNDITFLSVLTACSHGGLVDRGRKYFEAMSTDYGIVPIIEHYICMMDLLGRAGHLDEALQMAKTMPFQPNVAVWRTLLGACRKWSNVEVGQQAFESAVMLDEKDASSYVVMSNIYEGAQMWEEAKELQARRLQSRAWKQPGRSWCSDAGGVVHKFVVGDG